MNPSQQIDKKIAGLSDWRGDMLAKLRKLINAADSEIKEDWKWETAVWINNGNVCALGAFKDHVKLNFFKGALLADPASILNAGFDSKEHRAIDFSEGDTLNETGIKELVRAAVAINIQKL